MRRLLPLALVLLAGCGSAPEADLRARAEAAIEAANERDADAVRRHAQSLEQAVADLADAGELTDERARTLAALAASLQTSADVIDQDLLEQRRREAEAERLEQERARLEAERQQLEEDRRRAEAEREDKRDEEEGKGKGKGKDD